MAKLKNNMLGSMDTPPLMQISVKVQGCSTPLTAFLENYPTDISIILQPLYKRLRVLPECLMLNWSAMFDTTFNLVTSVRLP